MTQHICPRCNQRYITDPHCDDFQHECNSGNKTLDEEDVIVIGDWVDYTGEGTENNTFLQGSENEAFGTRAALDGLREQEETDRGARASTRRQRQHIEHIELEGGDC